MKLLSEENETLRRDLRQTVDERLQGLHPETFLNVSNDSIIEMQKRKLDLLEQERDDALQLCDESRQRIAQLEHENEDLKDPLKPHLIKLDMQTKQVLMK